MAEYIEREAAKDAVCKAFVRWGSEDQYHESTHQIDRIPAADVVEVVRCRECIYAPSGPESGGFALEWPHDDWTEDNPCPCKCEDGWYSHKPKPDFFCAYGEHIAAGFPTLNSKRTEGKIGIGE